MNIIFYCQHSLGIGHLMRTICIAQAMVDDFEVHLIVGGTAPEHLEIPSEITIHNLTPLSMSLDGTLVDPYGRKAVEQIKRERSEAALQIVSELRPELLVVEMFPFGRRKFHTEISAIIDYCKAAYQSLIVCSVRDILVSRGEKQDKYDRRALGILNKNFDALMIHSDPTVVNFNETFTQFEQINIPIHYTGYIAREALIRGLGTNEPCETRRLPQIVISVGGGRVGKTLLQIGIKASETLYREHQLETILLCGAMASEISPNVAGIPGLSVRAFTNEFQTLISSSQVSVSQCGYNTATDIIQTKTPCVFVPFETDSEDEQLRRARCLENLGIGILVREPHLTVENFIAAVLEAKKKFRTPPPINVVGVTNTRQILNRIIPHELV